MILYSNGKVRFKGTNMDGKYQWFWFLFFDLIHWLGLVIIIDGCKIYGFRADVSDMRSDSGRYLFCKLVDEQQATGNVLRIDNDGVVVYKNELNEAKRIP